MFQPGKVACKQKIPKNTKYVGRSYLVVQKSKASNSFCTYFITTLNLNNMKDITLSISFMLVGFLTGILIYLEVPRYTDKESKVLIKNTEGDYINIVFVVTKRDTITLEGLTKHEVDSILKSY